MKAISLIGLLFILSNLTLISCGPSEQEIKMREKSLRDSFALAQLKEKIKNDSVKLSKQEEEISREKPRPESKHEKTSTDIHDDPLSVVQAVFDAAKSGDLSILSELCDPTGAGDGDTKSLCSINNNSSQRGKEGFINYFKNGKITSNAVISGNRATVKFKFGPDGTKDEEFELNLVAGKWYLSSF